MRKIIKDTAVFFICTAVCSGLLFLAVWHGTSAEVWYAGQHTEGCDGSQDCGCYKKLLAQDAARVQNAKSGKR